MKFPIEILFRLLAEAYTAGLQGHKKPSFSEPKTPYYLILGNAFTGAYIQGQRQQEFDVPRCTEWLAQLPYEIHHNSLLGQLYNAHGTTFDAFWDNNEERIILMYPAKKQ